METKNSKIKLIEVQQVGDEWPKYVVVDEQWQMASGLDYSAKGCGRIVQKGIHNFCTASYDPTALVGVDEIEEVIEYGENGGEFDQVATDLDYLFARDWPISEEVDAVADYVWGDDNIRSG